MVGEWLKESIHPFISLYYSSLPSKGVWMYGYFTFSREKFGSLRFLLPFQTNQRR